MSGESSSKNDTRGGGHTSKKKKTSKPKITPSQYYLRNLHLDQHKVERASFGAPRRDDPKKQAMPTAVR